MVPPEALFGPHRIYENITQSLVAEINEQSSGLLLPVIYCGLWLFAWLVGLFICKKYVENRHCARRGVIVLHENPPSAEFGYMITVVSGHLIGGRTTSHVGIRLHGDNHSSQPRLLSYSYRHLDQRDDWFLMTCKESLGNLTSIEIWHDCTGAKPYMYLRNIIVRDLQNGYRWVFPAYQWLSLDHGTRRAYEVLTPGKRTKKNLFFDRLADGLQNDCVWISLFYMHPRSTYTSSQHFTVAMTSQLIVVFFTAMPSFYRNVSSKRDDDTLLAMKMVRSLWLAFLAVVISILLSLLFRVRRKDDILLDGRSQEELEDTAMSMRRSKWFGVKRGQCSKQKRSNDEYLKEFDYGIRSTGAKKKGNPSLGRRVERLLHMIDAAKNVRLANVFARTRSRDKSAKLSVCTIERKKALQPQDLESQTASTTGSGSVSQSVADSSAPDSVANSNLTSGSASGTVSGVISQSILTPEIHGDPNDKCRKDAALLLSNAYVELVQKDIQRLISSNSDPKDLVMHPNAGYMLKGSYAHLTTVMMRLHKQYILRSPPEKVDFWPDGRVALAWLCCLVLIGMTLYQVTFSSLPNTFVFAVGFITHNLMNWLATALIVSPLFTTISAFIMGYILKIPSTLDNKRGRGLAPVRFPRMWKTLRREPCGSTETMYRPLNKQESAILLVIRRHRIVFVNMLYDVFLWTAWLLLLVFVVVAITEDNFYFFTSHMNEIFVTASETRTQYARYLSDYRLGGDLFAYMKTTFSLGVMPFPDTADMRGSAINLMLDDQNYMVGIPTIRQVRVMPASLDFCDAPKEFRPSKCNLPYELSYVDTASYSKRWAPYERPAVTEWEKIWTYLDWQTKRSFYATDRNLYFYPGGGYVVSLADYYEKTLAKIEILEEDAWIDDRTRFLVLSTTVYSPAYESFVDLKVFVTVTRVGAFHSSMQADVVRQYPMYSLEDALSHVSIWMTICLGWIMLYRFFFIPKLTSKSIIGVQIINYFVVFLALLAFFNLLIAGIVFRMYLFDSNFADPQFHQGFSSIGWLSTSLNAIMAMLLIASSIRVAYAFKYFALFKIVMKTMRFALKPVFGMFLLLSIALVQFGISLAMLMGHASSDFHSPTTSVWWLVAFIVDSNNNYDDFYEIHFYHTLPVQVVRWLMILFIYFFFVNFMLAILTTMFHLAMQAVHEKERTEMTVSAFMRGKVRSFLHINSVTMHEEARQIALNKLTKMIVRERPLAARFPGIDNLPVSLSSLQAVDTIIERFSNHHVRRSQEHLDHVMATIIRNKTVADQPSSADDTFKIMRVFDVDGPKLVSAGRLALVARLLNIRQAEPIPHLTEIRSQLSREMIDSIRSLVLDGCEDLTIEAKETEGLLDGPALSAFSPYFPSINVRLRENRRQSDGEEVGTRNSEIVPQAELVLSPKLIHLHLSNKDCKKAHPSEPQRSTEEPNRRISKDMEVSWTPVEPGASNTTSLVSGIKFQSLEAELQASKRGKGYLFQPKSRVKKPPTFLPRSLNFTERS